MRRPAAQPPTTFSCGACVRSGAAAGPRRAATAASNCGSDASGNTYTQAIWPTLIARQFAAEPDPRKWTDRRAVGFVGGCAAWRQGGDTLRQEYPELAEEFAAKHDGG